MLTFSTAKAQLKINVLIILIQISVTINPNAINTTINQMKEIEIYIFLY